LTCIALDINLLFIPGCQFDIPFPLAFSIGVDRITESANNGYAILQLDKKIYEMMVLLYNIMCD
jgi:hypothetical protein